MRILAAEPDWTRLAALTATLRRVCPAGELHTFLSPQALEAWLDRHGPVADAVFLPADGPGLALARTLAHPRPVLVLDEPTAGLDPAGRENLMANIRDYHRNKGKTIILVSHSMDEIARNVDRILVLKNAHVLMQGTPAEVFARGEELLSAGLDVPQITRIAMELKRRGVDIDPAVYTVEALERQLLALRKGGAGC